MIIPKPRELKERGISWNDFSKSANVYEIYKNKLKDIQNGKDWWTAEGQNGLFNFVQELHQIQKNVIHSWHNIKHNRSVINPDGNEYSPRFNGLVNHVANVMLGYLQACNATAPHRPEHVGFWGENIPTPTEGALQYGLNVLSLLYSYENSKFGRIDDSLVEEFLKEEFNLSEGKAENIRYNVRELLDDMGRSSLRFYLDDIEKSFCPHYREK